MANKISEKKKSAPKSTTKKTTSTSNTRNNTKTKKKATKTTDKKLNVVIKNDVIETKPKKKSSKKEVEIVSLNTAKIENAKFKKKRKSLLPIGIIIVILGLAALIVSLIANRIIDREFISDNGIALMILISIIIEGFGAFIIVNES